VYLLAIGRQCGSIDAAVRSLGRALTVTSLTTIAGFGFLGLSAYPPLATLGRLMALGLVLSLIATFGVLPALAPRTVRRLAGAAPPAPEQR
jgi:predicted RND superfamily exporter protein